MTEAEAMYAAGKEAGAEIAQERIAAIEIENARLRDAVRSLEGFVSSRGARVKQVEAALRDCIPFLAVYMDRYRRDFELKELHPTHAEIIDRVSEMTGGEKLSEKLSARP